MWPLFLWNANTCSVVLLPGLYAAWEFGITEFSLSWILVIMQMLRIFLIVERRMIGRKFPGGPAGFPGFGMGISIPCWISVGISPVAAIRLKMLPLSSFGPYFSSSALMLSTPGLLLFFRRFAAVSISLAVKGSFILDGLTSSILSMFSLLNVFSKKFVMISSCSLLSLVKPSSPATRMFLVCFFCSIRTAWYILLKSFLYVSISSTDCIILEVSSSSIIWWMFFIMLFRSFCIFRRSALSQHEFICWPSCFCFCDSVFTVSLVDFLDFGNFLPIMVSPAFIHACLMLFHASCAVSFFFDSDVRPLSNKGSKRRELGY